MMRLQSVILAAALVLVATAAPAHAVGVVGAVAALIKGNVFLSAIAKLVVSVALSRLAQRLAPKPKQPGIKTEGTASGSQNPANFILGLYATNGVAVCPPMSHGVAGRTPNAYLTYVIELADMPGHALNALIINGERCFLGSTPHPDYGLPVNIGTYNGHAWVKFYNGTQTAADPMLLSRYSSYPQRPWSAQMIGAGICYAIVTFLYNRQVYTGFPEVRFEMLGIPLYDPRKDSTVGGSGAHRIGDPATWERTSNPIIMAYNIHLGIALPGGHVWGGGMPQADIPLASVFTAANICDVQVSNGEGSTHARFRAGYEVFVSDEPAQVCEELLQACLGQAADVGGFWKFQAGDPDLPVFFMTDGDVITTLARERQPFPSIEATRNGITASFPDPAVQWEPTEAPPIYNSTWEAQDGGRRRVVNIDFNAVPYLAQVQRNMRAMIADDRRFLTHGIPLPPEATVLEPLDTLSWTSDAYGYTGKTFEIVSTNEDLRTGLVQVNLRERDPSDTAVVPDYFIPVETPSTLPVIPGPQIIPLFGVSPSWVPDSAGNPRRPALTLTWAPDLPDVRGVVYEVRLQTGAILVLTGSTQNVAGGQLILSEGILPLTNYEVRIRPVVDRAWDWTPWLAVTSPNVLVSSPDIALGAITDRATSGIVWPTGSARLFSSFTTVETVLGPLINPGTDFWIVTISFEIERTFDASNQFTIQLRETRTVSATNATGILQTFNVMNDGDPAGPTGSDADGFGSWWPRTFAVIRGGRFGQIRWDARLSRTGTPTGRIRNLEITANRLLR
jgi:hypothetical protein